MQDQRAELKSVLSAFPGDGFAVFDGGQFDDLPNTFKSERLLARSLFLDQADTEIQKAGPWLLWLGQSSKTTDSVLAIVGDKPAAVFWCYKGREAVIRKHLRTLNMVRIPEWAAAGKHAPDMNDAPDATRLVFFRHFDPRVLGSVLPTLDHQQFCRFIGPAEEVAFTCEEYGLKRALAIGPDHTKRFPVLNIRSEQIHAISSRRAAASHRKIVRFVRKYAFSETKDLDDEALLMQTTDYSDEARRMGASQERSIGIWSYMRITSKFNLFSDSRTKRFLRDSANGPDVDARIQRLLYIRSEGGT